MNLTIQFTAEYEAEQMFKKILKLNDITDYEYRNGVYSIYVVLDRTT